MAKIKVGVKSFYFARQTTEDTSSSAPVYETPQAVEGLRTVNVEVEQSQNVLYADDKAFASENGTPEIKISLELAQMPLDVQAKLLGSTYDTTNKVLVDKSTDSPPYVAVLFSGTMSDGSNLGVKIYKLKFGIPSDEYQTKEQDVEWQPQTIEGKVVVLQNNNEWRYRQVFESNESMTSFFASVLPS